MNSPALPVRQEAKPLLEELFDETPVALDVGCGSGREGLVLLTSGWQVVCLDRDARALQRLGALAERQGCRESCVTVCCELEEQGDLLRALQGKSFHLVMVNRHLHRATLREMAELLKPGGLLLFHTFMEGAFIVIHDINMIQTISSCMYHLSYT